MTTGNGRYDGQDGGYGWGDSVLALNPDGTGRNGRPLDTYTPADFETLDVRDLDLGSTAPAMLPAPRGSRIAHPALQSGKDATLRLIDLDNMSGQGGPGHVGGEIALMDLPQGGEVLTQPAVWVDPADGATWTFVANNNGIVGLRLELEADGTPKLTTRWLHTDGGTSPLIANGVLYYAATGVLRALEPSSGALLWQSEVIGSIHWESPVVANGMLYMTDEQGFLSAFAPAASTPKVAVVEFYNAALDHYFVTPLQSEIDALDQGRLAGWTRTGLAFSAYADPQPGTNPVCRFYLPPGYGDSHFYSASPAECDQVRTRFPFFEYESSALFHVALPDPLLGACPAGTSNVYRVWNNRVDGNHRYVAGRALRDQMIAAGWLAEGYGRDAVIMCAPQ